VSDAPPRNFDLEEQIARIREALAQTSKFQAETDKLLEEARKFRRERWTLAISIISAISALVGAFGGVALFQALMHGGIPH
jgi:hypothetical protein